jgi:hypothetical protein
VTMDLTEETILGSAGTDLLGGKKAGACVCIWFPWLDCLCLKR